MFRAGCTNWVRNRAAVLTGMCVLVGSCAGPPDRISPGEVIGPVVQPTGPLHAPAGYLRVYTETRPFRNGDVTYYPHRSYKIYDEAGGLVQSVQNHKHNYDEKPTTVELPAGKYFVVPQGGGPGRPRIAVVIKGGEVTKVDVESLLRAKRDHP